MFLSKVSQSQCTFIGYHVNLKRASRLPNNYPGNLNVIRIENFQVGFVVWPGSGFGYTSNPYARREPHNIYIHLHKLVL